MLTRLDGNPLRKHMQKVLNKCTHVPLLHIIEDKANNHIEKMNTDGWELISVAPQAIGQFETFVMFWRKVVDVPTKP